MSSKSVILEVLVKVALGSIVGSDGGLGGSMSRGSISQDADSPSAAASTPSFAVPDLTDLPLACLRSVHSGALANCVARLVIEREDHEALSSLFSSAL